MRVPSITQGLLLGLLASAPLSAGYVVTEAGDKRHVGSLASYASHMVRDLLPRHHTEAQIAAKEAAAAASGNSNGNGGTASSTDPTRHHRHQAQNNNKREPHHTEAQIAAKEAAAAAAGNNNAATDSSTTSAEHHHRHQSQQNNNKREPHHTEAQIAAKEAAAAAHSGTYDKRTPQVPPPDEFGPWDSTEDEFGSWVDKREPHHTEAQIAAKEAAANSMKHGTRAAQTPPPDEFGPWDSTEDEFGSWVDKREPHHTEAQIAAKEKAAAAKAVNGFEKREPHHTEAQIAAKEKAAAAKAASSQE